MGTEVGQSPESEFDILMAEREKIAERMSDALDRMIFLREGIESVREKTLLERFSLWIALRLHRLSERMGYECNRW